MSGTRLNMAEVPKQYKDEKALYVCVTQQRVRLNIDPRNPIYVDDTTTDDQGNKFTFTLAHLRPFERWFMCDSKKALMLHADWLKNTAEGKTEAAKAAKGGK